MASDINLDQLHSFFELSCEWMAVLTVDGRFEQASPSWKNGLGLDPRELKGFPFFDLLHPEDLSRAQLEIQKLHQGAKRADFEGRCRGKDGEYRWGRWSCRSAQTDGRFYLAGRDVTELKEAEKSLQESQGKFKRLSDSAREGIAIHHEGVFVEVNQALATLLGYERPEDLEGLDGMDFPAPEFRPLVRDHVAKGYDQPYEIVMQRKDGSRFDCLVSGKPIQYRGHAMRVTTFLDITQMKKREKELFESQELFRKLAEASKDGIGVSEKGVILLANPALARMFGLEVSEMVGRNALEFTAPEFRETLIQKIMEESEAPYEVMGLRRNGTRFPVEITPRMTTYQGRRVRLSFFKDITQRKRIEEEILRQKEFNQNLINSSIDGLMAFDRECRYTLWNPAMERLTGHSREEVLGQCAFDVFPFLKQIGQDRYFFEALRGQTATTKDRPFRTPAGRQGFFEAVYSPLRNIQGEIVGGLGIIHETTDRKRAEEALRESETNLRAVFHNTFQNIILMDREGRVKAFNPNAAAFIRDDSGKALEVGRVLAEYVHPEDRGLFHKNIESVLRGEAVQVERPYRTAVGDFHWFEASYHPVFGAEGEIEGVCLTTLDIDDRKRVQRALEKSEADLRAVFNSNARGFILAGRNGRIRDFNQLARQWVLRMRHQELQVGRPLADYVEPEYVKDFKARFKRVLGGESLHLERVVKSPEGREEWFEFAYNPVCDPQGKVIGACAALGSIQERKAAVEALRKSESNLRAIFNSSTQAITVVDREGMVQYFNQVAAAFVAQAVGRGLEIGKSLADYVVKEAQEPFRKNIERGLKGEVVQGENLIRFPDGSRSWFEFAYRPVAGENGAVTGVCVTSLDIDDRKKAEEALRDSEEKFRRVFENAPLGMTLVDKDFRFLHANRAFHEMLGYAEGELAGKSFKDITHPDDLPRNTAFSREVLQGRGFQMQKRYLHKDGHVLWANLTVQSFQDSQGGFLHSMGMVEDITERKRADEALKRSEADLRAVFNSGSQVMVLIGPDGRVQGFNQSADIMARRVLGRGMEKGAPFIETLPPGADPEVYKASFQSAMEGKETQGERRIRSAEGKDRWVEVKYQPVLDEQGSARGVCFSLAFIDDRKRAEELLRKSEADLRAVFNSGSQMIVFIGRDGRIRDFNQLAGRYAGLMTGQRFELGRLFLDYVQPPFQAAVRERFERILQGETIRVENSIPDEDGAPHWFEMTFTPVFDGQGSVTGLCLASTLIDDRKKAEEALRESRERLKRLTDLTREGILIHENPRVVDVNPAMAQMLGYSPEEMIGRSGFDFLAPPSREEALRRMKAASPDPYEALALKKDGSFLPVELNGRNFKEGERELRVLSVRDITWRKEAEKTLRESEERYRTLVELMPEAMVVHAAGRVLYVNSAGLGMFGASPEDVEGSSISGFLHPDSRKEALDRVKDILETGRSTDWIEQKLVKRDGQVFEAETKGSPILYRGIPGVMTLVRDITERKKAERALRESESDYRRLVAEIPLALVVSDKENIIVSANAEAARLFGAANPVSLIGKSAVDFILPENRAVAKERMRATLEGASAPNRETELVTLAGERAQVEVRGFPVTFQGQKFVMSILRDITEGKKLHEMLLRYERLAAVGKVIAGIAHEVRNPLAVVAGMSQILKAKLENRSEYSQELETILAQANRLQYFMNDILDYSRNLEVKKAPVFARALLEDSLLLAQAQLGPSHAATRVEWNLEERLPDLPGDAERLQQVLVNLIVNAYQAMEEKGTLTLSARVKDGWMLLGVEDDGPGIAEADTAKLFEPFFTTKKHGSGLGLPISQKIAWAHGGRISVKRLTPHGTLFTLQLPLEKTE